MFYLNQEPVIRWTPAYENDRSKIKNELAAGNTIICDRFYHSGIVYSAAKQLPSLSLSWAKAPEVGLPRPDMVLFLDLDEEVARGRGGWGGEVYEKGEMQRRVRELFWGLSMGDLGRPTSSSAAADEEVEQADVDVRGVELEEAILDSATEYSLCFLLSRIWI